MSVIAWEENLSTGVKEIDDDHKELVELYNDLANASAPGIDAEVFKETLGKLVTRTVIHFCREETLMLCADYIHIDAHRSEHDALLSSVQMLQSKYRQRQNQQT